MFQIGGNFFYDQKYEILIKFPGEKRFGIRMIMESHGILTKFPN
jgi:hypothetical protein